ncbi:Hypothetical predicted protein [Pelobates cultripes]|uniref:Uncharacterized protein n=1 Tax=Pelobates cultripes TaxID=61616 RepID=A0AAD1QY14_PELCU|nr:Hypothetical predicted protein [Pelobates cultripes]
MLMDICYRLQALKSGTMGTSRDVIIWFQNGSDRSLLVPRDTGTLKIIDAFTVSGTLHTLGLSMRTGEQQQPGPLLGHTAWDPARVLPFVPAANRENPASTAVA